MKDGFLVRAILGDNPSDVIEDQKEIANLIYYVHSYHEQGVVHVTSDSNL